MKYYAPIFASIVFALSSCAQSAVRLTPMGVDNVIQSAASLEGQRVAVSGYLRFGDDSRNLWSSKAVYLNIKNGNRPAQATSDHCIALYDIANWRRILLSNNGKNILVEGELRRIPLEAVSYTHLRAHETPEHLVCR